MNDVTSDPRWGKYVQKFNKMSPADRAIFSVAAPAAAKAREDIQAMINALDKSVSEDQRRTNQMLAKKDIEYKEKTLESEKDLSGLAHGLGIANLAGGVLSGINRMRRENKRAQILDTLLNGMTTE